MKFDNSEEIFALAEIVQLVFIGLNQLNCLYTARLDSVEKRK